jgi:uncharacterized MnhB-related membrane protein
MLELLNLLLLLFLIVCAVAVARTRDILVSVIIFAAYSLVMALLWQQLEAPDLALTEAVLGAGVTTILFLVVINKTRRSEE